MTSKPKTILVIEDDAETVQLLRLTFRRRGIKIVTWPNGEECLAAAQALQPDLILLDIMMPGMDGWEIYQRMQASPNLRLLPIIIISAKPEPIARLHGQNFDTVASYIRKPFSPRALVTLVEQCLGSPTKDCPATCP